MPTSSPRWRRRARRTPQTDRRGRAGPRLDRRAGAGAWPGRPPGQLWRCAASGRARGKLAGADSGDYRITYLEREPGRLQQLLELLEASVLQPLARRFDTWLPDPGLPIRPCRRCMASCRGWPAKRGSARPLPWRRMPLRRILGCSARDRCVRNGQADRLPRCRAGARTACVIPIDRDGGRRVVRRRTRRHRLCRQAGLGDAGPRGRAGTIRRAFLCREGAQRSVRGQVRSLTANRAWWSGHR